LHRRGVDRLDLFLRKRLKHYLGIDPGASGAIALYRPHGRVLVRDMPTHTVTIANRKARRIDAHALADIIAGWNDAFAIAGAVIEQVTASPQMGVTSAFAFGEAFGMAKQAVAGCRIPVQMVRPQEWKAHFKLIGKDKDESRLRASQLLPADAQMWERKMDDGRAEAALLAIFASMK
jgi:crossover junction endodeoxyribonuclease RuvC